MRVLLVEDEKRIIDDLTVTLEEAGYVLDVATDGEDAWFQAETSDPDAIILDLGLPRLDGLTVLRRIRQAGIETPVLILTARSSWTERVEGIDAGADDYLGKPFASKEVLARLGAIIRRSKGHASSVIDIGRLRIDTRRIEATVDGRVITLTPLEYRLLRFLALNKGRVTSQGEIADHVYGGEHEPDSNTIEVPIGRLRRKVGDDLLTTRRGFGYILEA
jgi:two-component system OmpR family response regulator